MPPPASPFRPTHAECLTVLLIALILIVVLLPRCRSQATAADGTTPAPAEQLAKQPAPVP